MKDCSRFAKSCVDIIEAIFSSSKCFGSEHFNLLEDDKADKKIEGRENESGGEEKNDDKDEERERRGSGNEKGSAERERKSSKSAKGSERSSVKSVRRKSAKRESRIEVKHKESSSVNEDAKKEEESAKESLQLLLNTLKKCGFTSGYTNVKVTQLANFITSLSFPPIPLHPLRLCLPLLCIRGRFTRRGSRT